MSGCLPAYFSLIEPEGFILPAGLFEQEKPYLEHQILWKLFPQRDEREFLFRRLNPQGGRARLGWYIVSKIRPTLVDGMGLKVTTKLYHPSLSVGQRLRFSIRANPVVTRKSAGETGKRHDLVMDLKHQFRKSKNGDDLHRSLFDLRHQAAIQWLARRSQNAGFSFLDSEIVAEGYQLHNFKRLGRNGNIATLDIEGILTVTEPEVFLQILVNGLGPAKAFGCGLVTVKPL